MALLFSVQISIAQTGAGIDNISLPVKLEYFNIEQTSPKKLLLNWKTAEQYTNVVYELQRALDNYEFSTIAYILPPDNSSTPRTYEYRDDITGLNVKKVLFYRIKQTQNGKTSFSDVKAFRMDAGGSETLMQVFPNPVKNSFQVNIYTDKKSAANLLLQDINGKTVWAKTLVAEAGNNTYNINEAAGMSGGSYFMRVLLNGELIAVKQIIKL
jgi:hypothetical protein